MKRRQTCFEELYNGKANMNGDVFPVKAEYGDYKEHDSLHRMLMYTMEHGFASGTITEEGEYVIDQDSDE